MNTILKKLLIISLFALFFSFASANSAFAASGSISANPSSNTVAPNQSFNVAIRINGGGESFNAAQAAVAVSSQLTVNDLVIGDCGFTFFLTPTVSKPSFIGGILGGNSNNCTVFTLNLKASSTPSTGSVTITNGSIISSQNFSQLLSFIQNGNYQITNNSSIQVTPVPSIAAVVSTTDLKQTSNSSPTQTYTAQIKVLDDKNNPIVGAEVQSSNGQIYTTDGSGVSTISNLESGLNEIKVTNGNKLIAKELIGIQGDNPNLEFTIKEGTTESSNQPTAATGTTEKPTLPAQFPIVAALGAILASIIALVVVIFIRR